MHATTEDELTALRKAHKTLSDDLRALKNDNFRLAEALRKYVHCRHACVTCPCVNEARAALFEE
jgi:hypothetical protein